MNQKNYGIVTFLTLLLSLLVAQSDAQVPGSAKPKPVMLTVGAETYIRYPSLEPVTAVSVQLATPAEVYDLMKEVIGPDPKHPIWDCTRSSSYKIAVVSQSGKGPLKEVRTETITYVALQGNDPQGNRLTYCQPGEPGQIQLIFKSDLGASESVQVTLMGLPNGLVVQSDGKLQFKNSVVSFSVTPQAAPSEKLTNGKSRDTGQLNLSFTDSNLFSAQQLPFNTYVKSSDLFSTDEKDSKSSFSGTLGAQRGVFPRWYAPLHFEETMQGNQIATNLSSVTTLGVTTLVPWAWSGKLFYNRVFQASLPPDVTVNNQYTHRINELITPTSKALATDDYALNPFLSWSSIHFPWACTVLGWFGPKASSASGKVQYCLGTELDLGTYYLPLDLTRAKNQRVEGYGDISILIPLSGLSFASRIFPYMTSGDPAKSQIRIKYSDSVTAANNYARSKQWTYGIELIK